MVKAESKDKKTKRTKRWDITNEKIVKVILKKGKISFGELLEETGLSKPSLNDHLKDLLSKNLIFIAEKSQKDKRKWLYSVNTNELALITVDEVIEAIKEELKAIGEELKPEEEQALRDILSEHISKAIIEELKADIPIAKYGIVRHIFDYLTSIVFIKAIIDNYDPKMAEESLKAIFPKATFYHSIPQAVPKMPDSFIEKWEKTKAFKSNPLTTLANLFITGKLEK